MFDLVVIGAGPAGCASAIWGAMHGLKVMLIERGGPTRPRPGECFHPGIESVFERLGVIDEVRQHAQVRPDRRTFVGAGESRVECFGADARGPWRAWHVLRSDLDAILLDRARYLGASVLMPCSRVTPVVSDGGIAVVVDGQTLPCSFVIDASGHSAWLTRALGGRLVPASPRLTAFYGYENGRLAQEQLFEVHSKGWSWSAQVSPSIMNWTSLYFGVHKRTARSGKLRFMGADVTWRIAPTLAGHHYFIVGDAACVTDPACGNGVLRALMSGIKAAQNARAVLGECITPADAAREYEAWMRGWFTHDIAKLSSLYDSLCSSWRDVGPVSAPPKLAGTICPSLAASTR